MPAVGFYYPLPVRNCIFLAWTIQPTGLPSSASSKAVGGGLLRRLLVIGVAMGGMFGAVANASAGISLRVTLATTGLPSTTPYNLPKESKAGVSSGEQAAAQAAAQAKAAAQAQLRVKVKALVKLYAAKSDKELTNLSAQWQELPRLDQQVLLREVKMRMARQRGRKGSVQIRTERRFGRLLRQADGSVVRVETRVVQVRPATKDEQANQVRVRKSGYGTGFGRRAVQGSGQEIGQGTRATPVRADAQREPQSDAEIELQPAPGAKP